MVKPSQERPGKIFGLWCSPYTFILNAIESASFVQNFLHGNGSGTVWKGQKERLVAFILYITCVASKELWFSQHGVTGKDTLER